MLFLPSEASPFPTGSSFGLRTEKTGSGGLGLGLGPKKTDSGFRASPPKSREVASDGSAFSAARPSVSAAENLPTVRSFSIEGVSVQDLLSDWIQPEHRRTAPWLLRANVTVT